MNTWESYKKFKQRRNTRDTEDNNNQAFAMLVSNAINATTNPSLPQETQTNDVAPDVKETNEETEEKPRTNRYGDRMLGIKHVYTFSVALLIYLTRALIAFKQEASPSSRGLWFN